MKCPMNSFSSISVAVISKMLKFKNKISFRKFGGKFMKYTKRKQMNNIDSKNLDKLDNIACYLNAVNKVTKKKTQVD